MTRIIRRVAAATLALAVFVSTSACAVRYDGDGRVLGSSPGYHTSRPPAWGWRTNPPPRSWPQRPWYGQRQQDRVVCDRSDQECYRWDQHKRRYQPAYGATEDLFGERAEDRQRDRWD
jgi:hypothetical protein